MSTARDSRGEGRWEERFVALGSAADAIVQAARDLVTEDLPEDPSGALSVNELKDRHPMLSHGTLDRALAALGARRIGEGKRGDPFRYYRPEKVFPTLNPWMGRKKRNRWP